MSYTRAALRRAVAREIMEPLTRFVPEGYVTPDASTGSHTTTAFYLNAGYAPLFNTDDWWNKSTVYAATGDNAGEERRVVDYDASEAKVTVAPGFSNAPADGDEMEFHSRTTARFKNEAINGALDDGWPYFFSEVTREIIIPEDVARLTSDHNLPTDWHQLLQLHLEPPRTIQGPFATTAVTTTTVTTGQTWTTNVFAGSDTWEIAFTKGEGMGQSATITSNTTDTLTFTPAITDLVGSDLPEFYLKKVEAPDIWHGAWIRVADVQPLGHPLFSELLLPGWLQDLPGRTLLLVGLKRPDTLDSDTDTTTVPERYLVPAAAGRLALRLSFTSGAEHEGTRFAGRWDAQEAERLKRQLAWKHPPGTKWRPPHGHASAFTDDTHGDPLRWRY